MNMHQEVASRAAAAARERRERSTTTRQHDEPEGTSMQTNNMRGSSVAAEAALAAMQRTANRTIQTNNMRGSSVAAEAALAAMQRTTNRTNQSLMRPCEHLTRPQKHVAKAAAQAAAASALAKKHTRDAAGNDIAMAIEKRGKNNVLISLIQSFEWQSIPLWCSTHPQDAKFVDPVSNMTPLHLICSIGSAPPYAVTAVLYAWVGATMVQNRRYFETPLHIQCRNSQKTSSKVEALIQQAPEAVSVLNKERQSPLHVACFSNAMLPVVQMLLKASPSMLTKIDRFGDTPLSVLWGSYCQSIPGQLALCRVKMGLSCDEGHLKRFWAKVEMVALRTYYFLNSITETNYSKLLLGHAIVSIPRCPRLMLDIALNLQPELARVQDDKGNYPLHSLLLRDQPLDQERAAIKLLLKAFAPAAKLYDHTMSLPLQRAIERGISWDKGLYDIMKAAPDSLDRRDCKCCLFPFMMAACVGGPDSLSDTYALLAARPELVGSAVSTY